MGIPSPSPETRYLSLRVALNGGSNSEIKEIRVFSLISTRLRRRQVPGGSPKERRKSLQKCD